MLCTRGVQIPSTSWRRGINSLLWRQCVWVLGIKLVSWHPSGALNFEVVPRFLENFVHPYSKLTKFPSFLPDTWQLWFFFELMNQVSNQHKAVERLNFKLTSVSERRLNDDSCQFRMLIQVRHRGHSVCQCRWILCELTDV